MKQLVSSFRNKLSLGGHLVIGVFLLIFMATSVQVYLASRMVEVSAVNELQVQLSALARYNVKELEYRINRLRGDVLFLSKNPAVAEIAQAALNNSGSEDSETLVALKARLGSIFTAFMEAKPEYFQLRYIGVADGGRELIRVQMVDKHVQLVAKKDLQQKGNRDYFISTLSLSLGEVFFSNIDLNQEFGVVEVPHRRTIRASTPVFSKEGKVFGIVIINMDIGSTLDKLSASSPHYVDTYLTNNNGDFLVHPNSSHTFGFNLGESYKWQDEVSHESVVNTSKNKMVSFYRAGELYYGEQERLIVDGNDNRFLTLTYAVNEAFVGEESSNVRNLVIAYALGILLLLVVIIYFYTKRLLRPLVQLSEATNEIGSGNYTISFPVLSEGTEEIKKLTQAFELMLSRIAARESEVIEANRQLSAALHYADLVLESVPEALIIVNHEGRIIQVNRQTSLLFGYDASELLGKEIEVLLPASFKGKHMGFRNNYLSNPSTRTMGKGMSLFAARKNGSEFPVEIGLNVIKKADGIDVLASIIDITERKKYEESLIHSNTRFSLAASAAGLGFWDYDLISNDLQWDEEMYKIYGHPISDDKKRPYSLWSQSLHPDDRETSERTLQSAIRGEKPFDTEFRIIQPSGNIRYIKAQAYVMRNDAGDAVKMYGVNIDITAQKESEKKQQRLVKNLTLINNELDSFTYIASHDLKSPLRGIDQLATWIMEDLGEELKPETKKHLTLMRTRIDRMEKLLDDLLQYSKVGKTTGDCISIDTRKIVGDTVELFSSTKNIQLNITSALPVIVAEKVPLEVVFRNLIGNAIKHHHKHDINLSISVKESGRFFEFAIKDDGPGIPVEHQTKIFNMFQTLKPRDKVEGSGIGLALVKKIVESVGGSVRVESDGQQGCCFYFTWPCQPLEQER